MNRYFVMQVTTDSVGTATAVTEKATIDEARGLFHQILASIYANTDVTYGLVMVINEQGFCEVMEQYPRVPEPEE